MVAESASRTASASAAPRSPLPPCLLAAATSLLVLALAPSASAWGAGHAQVHNAALALQAPAFRAALNATSIVFPPGSSGAPQTLAELLAGPLAESADAVAGPCAPNITTPCSADDVSTKLLLRNFCYAEGSDGRRVLPWPYAVPECNSSTGLPPPGWSGCLPGPKTWSWLYHYFTEAPPQNQGFEARGAAWYIGSTAQALREGNVTTAALLLGCFAHGLEDRSSPYHCWGGDDAGKAAVEAEHNLTATCRAKAPPPLQARCEIEFWGGDDSHIDVAAAGYTPALLGATAADAGAVVGVRMEALANASRSIAVAPGGYVETHLADANWWTGAAGPATKVVEGRMATMSTRLVADAWHTAWALSRSSDARQGWREPPRAAPASRAVDDARWLAAVKRAAAADLAEPARRR